MNRAFRILFGMVSALLVVMPAAAAEIHDTFDVALPAGFADPAKTTMTSSGIETTTWVSKSPTGEAVVVSVSKMPARIADPAKLMDSTRDSLLKSVKGTLESEQPVAGDMPSRLLVFRSGTAFLRSRLVVSGDKLYQLLYVGRSEEQRAVPAVMQMFDSFKVTAPAMTSSVAAAPPPAPKP